MAGGVFTGKADPKKVNLFKNSNSSEVLKDSHLNSAPKKFSLSGVLGLGQTVELNKEVKPQNWGKEFLGNTNYLQQQEISLLKNVEKESKKAIDELRYEIQKLIKSTDNLDKKIQSIPLENIPEVSEYQINFLTRIKNYIINFRKNINEASTWLDSLQGKKSKKRNLFWNTAKNKKRGGEQYLMSNEHSDSRSVN